MIPAVLGHLLSVKTGKPRLNLPKCMPASFSGVTDMEVTAPAAPAKKGGTGGMVAVAIGIGALVVYFWLK